MRTKHLFTWFREERSTAGFDALDFSSAEPDSSVVVDVAAITHAMPNGCNGSGLTIADFRSGRGLGYGVVAFRDGWATDDDFADFSAREFMRVGERSDGSVGNGNDLHLVR